MNKTHKIGDRVVVLHNIMLGNLIGTVKAIHERPTEPVYDVELDGGGTDHLYGFQLQTLESDDRIPCPDCGEKHRPAYHDQEPCNECVERLLADSGSQRIAGETADETSGRSAYNAGAVTPGANGKQMK